MVNGILKFQHRTLTVNGSMTMSGTSSVTGNANSRILSLQGNFNVPAGQSVTAGGVRISQIITGTFNLAGTFTPTDNTGIKTFGNANFFDGCLIDATVAEGTFYLLPTTYYLLPTTYYLLPITYYLLPITC